MYTKVTTHSTFASLLLAVLLIAGCGGETEQTSTQAAPAMTPEEIDAAFQEAVTAFESTDDQDAQAQTSIDFLELVPDSKYTLNVVKHVALEYNAKQKGNPAAGIAFIKEHMKRVSDETAEGLQPLLIELYGMAGDVDALRDLSEEMTAERATDFRTHLKFANAALAAEAWDLAIRHAQASLEALPAAEEKVEDNGDVTRRLESHRSNALSILGRAQTQAGDIEAALASFAEAEQYVMFNFIGVSDYNDINFHWARALIAAGDYDAAMRRIAPDAIMRGDERAKEIFKEAYEKSGGDTADVEKAMDAKRDEFARALPEFEVYNYDGEKVAWSDVKGEVTILNFWFPTCPPCREELPGLKAMYEKYKDRGFRMVVIDGLRMTERGKQFIKEHELPYIFLETGEGEENVVQKVFGVGTYPTSFVVDKEGRVRYYHLGFNAGDEVKIEEEIVSLLEE